MNDRKLSTLELTVLGMVWLRGPCTIYSVMKELSSSASTYYKSRAGTAYSIANRLLKFELIAKEELPTGKDSNVKITAEGIEALKAWITPPIPINDIAHSADLIRLRFFFLEVVDLQTRIAFIDQARDDLETFLSRCETLLGENEAMEDHFGILASLSTVFETRARIHWLTVVRDWVINPPSRDQSWADLLLKNHPRSLSAEPLE